MIDFLLTKYYQKLALLLSLIFCNNKVGYRKLMEDKSNSSLFLK